MFRKYYDNNQKLYTLVKIFKKDVDLYNIYNHKKTHMRTFAKSQIRFSKSQRMGIFALIALLFCFEAYDIFFNKTYSQTQFVEESFLTSLNEENINSEFSIDLVDESKDEPTISYLSNSQVQYTPSTIQLISEDDNVEKNVSSFDPNSYGKRDWMNLGFSEELSKALLDCKNNLGGYFKTVDEIENCLGNHKEKFRQIESLIKFKTAQSIEATIDLIEEIENEPISDFAIIELIEE